MTTLHALGLTPAHLSPAVQDLVIALQFNSCAWKIRNGWRPKRPGGKDFKKATGDVLVRKQLATIESGKGSLRLVLTGAGEDMAKAIAEARGRKGRAA